MLRAAIIGCGFMGSTHTEALRRLGIPVAGLCGIDPEESQNAARHLNLETAYRSFEQVLADPGVDVVHLCTPNFLHYSMAKAALQAGKHVLCEKPVANTSTEAAEMVKLEKDAKRVGAVNYNLRFYPLNQEARARIAANDLGEIRIIHGEYCQDWLFLPSDWNWRLEPHLGGSLRVVADIGTHWMDAVTWLTGLEIRSVCADFATFLPTRYKPKRAVETFAGKLSTKIEGDPVEIKTEDYASILFKDPSLMRPAARPVAAYPGGHAEGYPDTFVQLFKAFYGYIAADDFGKPRPFATFEDGRRELVLCEAIQRSAEERRWIDVVY
jgi:predicted dehydrogenase